MKPTINDKILKWEQGLENILCKMLCEVDADGCCYFINTIPVVTEFNKLINQIKSINQIKLMHSLQEDAKGD